MKQLMINILKNKWNDTVKIPDMSNHHCVQYNFLCLFNFKCLQHLCKLATRLSYDPRLWYPFFLRQGPHYWSGRYQLWFGCSSEDPCGCFSHPAVHRPHLSRTPRCRKSDTGTGATADVSFRSPIRESLGTIKQIEPMSAFPCPWLFVFSPQWARIFQRLRSGGCWS